MAVRRVITVTYADGRVGRHFGVAPLAVRIDSRHDIPDQVRAAIETHTARLLGGVVTVTEFAMDTHTGYGLGFVRQIITGTRKGKPTRAYRTVAYFETEGTTR